MWALTAINIAAGARRILLPGQKLIAINASFSPCFIKFYGRHKKKTRRTRNRRDKDKDVERNRLEKALKFGLEETLPASDAVAILEPVPREKNEI